MPKTVLTGLGRLCARRGLSLSALARALDLDPSVPRLWANGARAVPANRVAGVCAVLGVSQVELAGVVRLGWSEALEAARAGEERAQARKLTLLERYGLRTGCGARAHVAPVRLGGCLEEGCRDAECERWECAACGATWRGNPLVQVA